MTSSAPQNRRRRKRQNTASHISATAYRLFEAHGYDSVSMEQVATEADVAKATLYNYFPVKEALIAHRFREDIVAGMAERAAALSSQTTFDARMRYLLRESAAWHSARKTYLPAYLRFLTSRASYGEQPRDDTYDSGSLQMLALMFESGRKSGEVSTQQTAAEIAWSFQYLLFGAISGWLNEPTISLEKRFLAAFDLTMHGVTKVRRK